MPRYTPDNTSGYSPAELTILNARYEEAIRELSWSDHNADDLSWGSVCDATAERILHEFDMGYNRDIKGEE